MPPFLFLFQFFFDPRISTSCDCAFFFLLGRRLAAGNLRGKLCEQGFVGVMADLMFVWDKYFNAMEQVSCFPQFCVGWS